MGAVQRAALQALHALDVRMLDSIAVACEVYGHNSVTEDKVVSVRRALRSLAQAGQVTDLGRGWHSGRRVWALPERAGAYRGRVRQVFGQ